MTAFFARQSKYGCATLTPFLTSRTTSLAAFSESVLCDGENTRTQFLVFDEQHLAIKFDRERPSDFFMSAKILETKQVYEEEIYQVVLW